jgi:hypothetical protein
LSLFPQLSPYSFPPFHDVSFVADTDGIREVEEAIQSNRGIAKPHGKPEDDFGYDRQEIMRKKKRELNSQEDFPREKGKKMHSHFI